MEVTSLRKIWMVCFAVVGCISTDREYGGFSSAEVVRAGAPVLREKSRPISLHQIHTKEFQSLIDKMILAMREAPGVGLAAPQIGVPLRVLVMEDTEQLMGDIPETLLRGQERSPVSLKILINPEIKPIGVERVAFFEGCLSMSGFNALVERWREIEVSGYDRTGVQHRVRVHGWPARILQHEADHLDGVLYIDRMYPGSFGTHSANQARFGAMSIEQVRRVLAI